MESSHIPTVMFIGNTGTGKSAVCNYFHQKLAKPQDQKSPFQESNGAKSTKMVSTVAQSYHQIKIVDTPGLSDSGGSQQDVVNLRKILEFTKEQKFVHSFTFVLNEYNPRFDESTQATFCLFYTHYGPQFLKHVNFIFTRASRLKFGKVQTQEKVQEFIDILSERLKIPIQNFPQFNSFQFECHPDQLEELGASDFFIQQVSQRTESEFVTFLETVIQSQTLDTTQNYEDLLFRQKVHAAIENLKIVEEKSKKIEEQLKIAEAINQDLQRQKLEKIQAEKQIIEANQKLESYTKQELPLTESEIDSINKKVEQFLSKVAGFEQKNIAGQVENIQLQIHNLQQQREQVKQELNNQKDKISRWWWLLASPVFVPVAAIAAPVGLGVAAGAATFAATASMIAAICRISFFFDKDEKKGKK